MSAFTDNYHGMLQALITPTKLSLFHQASSANNSNLNNYLNRPEIPLNQLVNVSEQHEQPQMLLQSPPPSKSSAKAAQLANHNQLDSDDQQQDLQSTEHKSKPDSGFKPVASSNTAASNPSTSGRWTHEEHIKFIEGLKIFGRNWKKVEEYIGTRTGAQIRSHAQKYFNKVDKDPSSATIISTQNPTKSLPQSQQQKQQQHQQDSNQQEQSSHSPLKPSRENSPQQTKLTSQQQQQQQQLRTQQQQQQPINNIQSQASSFRTAATLPQSPALIQTSQSTTFANILQQAQSAILSQLPKNQSNFHQTKLQYEQQVYPNSPPMLMTQSAVSHLNNAMRPPLSFNAAAAAAAAAMLSQSSPFGLQSLLQAQSSMFIPSSSVPTAITGGLHSRNQPLDQLFETNSTSSQGYHHQQQASNPHNSSSRYIFEEKDSEDILDKFSLRQIQEPTTTQDNSFFLERNLAELTTSKIYDMCAMTHFSSNNNANASGSHSNSNMEYKINESNQSGEPSTSASAAGLKGKSRGYRPRFGSFKLHDEDSADCNMKYEKLRKASVDDQELRKKFKLNESHSSSIYKPQPQDPTLQSNDLDDSI